MKKILIVEDEHALREVFAMLFRLQGYTVYEAGNGKEAQKFLEKKIDLIILDMLMPVMGGIQFLEATDLKMNYPATKVLVLSNLSDAQTLDRIKELGVDKYILKSSVAPNKLVEEVGKMLATK